MFQFIKERRVCLFCKVLSSMLSVVFVWSTICPSMAMAQSVGMLNLPIPGTMVNVSPAFVPVLLKGMTIHPEDPLKFDFIVDSGNTGFETDEVRSESERLVKYFLASMTIPKDDLWVNLSPYESDRIIPDELGKTELGRDLLAQDYILKQLTATMMHPDSELGEQFWNKVRAQAKSEYGVDEVPTDTFNKVWILPDQATVYEHEQTVYVVSSKLKVMTDADYLAAQSEGSKTQPNLNSEIIKEIIIPAIEKEVNEGKNFAPLRQIYHSLILAKWYKETIKTSLLSQVYVDQGKVAGVELDDKAFKEGIYDQYMQAYKKGVFNFIKEDYDALSQQMIPRKYFSGGIKDGAMVTKHTKSYVEIAESVMKPYKMALQINPQKDGAGVEVDSAMLANIEKTQIVSVGSPAAHAMMNIPMSIEDALKQIPGRVISYNEIGFYPVGDADFDMSYTKYKVVYEEVKTADRLDYVIPDKKYIDNVISADWAAKELLKKNIVTIKSNDGTPYTFELQHPDAEWYIINVESDGEKVGFFDFNLGFAANSIDDIAGGSNAIEVGAVHKGVGRALVSLALALSYIKGEKEFLVLGSVTDNFWNGVGFKFVSDEVGVFKFDERKILDINIQNKNTERRISNAILFDEAYSSENYEEVLEKAVWVSSNNLGSKVEEIFEAGVRRVRVLSKYEGRILYEYFQSYNGMRDSAVDEAKKNDDLKKAEKFARRIAEKHEDSVVVTELYENNVLTVDGVLDKKVRLLIVQEIKNESHEDQAMVVAKTDVGGIDMNDISVDYQGSGINIQFDPIDMQGIIDMGIDGFVPVIMNITPIQSIMPLLGFATRRDEDEELALAN